MQRRFIDTSAGFFRLLVRAKFLPPEEINSPHLARGYPPRNQTAKMLAFLQTRAIFAFSVQ
jgi:hypothetical protein